MSINTRNFLLVTLFGIAMANFESSVVIYLREIMYPDGFEYPLKLMDYDTAEVEFIREAASIIMIITVAMIASKSRITRFALFLYIFAIWDIFYYVFLKLLISWPESIFVWDILFLLPVIWVGPVLAPIINSLTMVALAMAILYAQKNEVHNILHVKEWSLLIGGALIVIAAYTEDFVNFLLEKLPPGEVLSKYYSEEIVALSSSYIPDNFCWWLYGIGVALHITAILLVFKKGKARKA